MEVQVNNQATVFVCLNDDSDEVYPVAVFTQAGDATNYQKTINKGFEPLEVPLNPPLPVPEPKLHVLDVGQLLYVIYRTDLRPGEKSNPGDWEIADDGKIMRILVAEEPYTFEARAKAIQQACHLIGAGIWLKPDQWDPWFISIAIAIRELNSQGSPLPEFPVELHAAPQSKLGSVLVVFVGNKRLRFNLFPNTEHPNGEATVKWITDKLHEAVNTPS